MWNWGVGSLDYEVVGHKLKGELEPEKKGLNIKLKNLGFILEAPGRHQRLLNR
jgi:hypothetical protein